MTFRISLDSSIFISQLTGDVHAEAVLTALTVLETMGAELTLPLLCYAELYTGVNSSPRRPVQWRRRPWSGSACQPGLAGGENVAIAREAARVKPPIAGGGAGGRY